MDAHQLSNRFLQSIDGIVNAKEGKWAFTEFKTARGVEVRNGFLDACSELFVVFIGHPQPLVYGAICEALRQRGGDWSVQRYAGMALLNLVPDVYGQVDELIDLVAPVFDVSNGEIPAFLVEQVGLEPLLRKIKARKAGANSELAARLDGLTYQAEIYQNGKAR